jgi:integrase/recombinase XerD
MGLKYSKEWLRPEELKQILSLPDISEKYETWILLLYVPALRVSEAINIRLRDLDLKSQSIEVWGGKGYDPSELRKAPCDANTLKRIIRYCEHQGLRPADFVMCSQKSKQVDRSQVYRVVNKLCQQAGISKTIGTHTFRRSRAEHLLDSGLPLPYVSKYLRHRNISTTMAYLHVSVADIQREMLKIEDPIAAIL